MEEIIQKVKNLSVGFKSQKGHEISILKNITTNIKKGETVGIVGESGSGKSTLALAMMGYVKQGLYTMEGECIFNLIYLFIVNRNSFNSRIRSKRIGFTNKMSPLGKGFETSLQYQLDKNDLSHMDQNKKHLSNRQHHHIFRQGKEMDLKFL